jgi:DNA topoisomerase VI subunit B
MLGHCMCFSTRQGLNYGASKMLSSSRQQKQGNYYLGVSNANLLVMTTAGRKSRIVWLVDSPDASRMCQ